MEDLHGNNAIAEIKDNLSLEEFCDMKQLYRLLGNWSKSCGMATMLFDADGNPISEEFGFTEFCRMIQAEEKGIAKCRSTWKCDTEGIYECPVGFLDFSVPIALPDGRVLGKVLAGQAMSNVQRDEDILKKTSELGLEEDKVKDILSRVTRRTKKEMQGAYELLRETLHFFVLNSYYIWQTRSELKRTPEKKDRTLS